MYFYTHTERFGNNILARGYRDGKQFFDKIHFKPKFYIPTKKDTMYRSIHGLPLEELEFSSMSEAKNFLTKYQDVDNFSVYGMEKYDVQYRCVTWPNEIIYDYNIIRVLYLDIETDSEGGFGDVALANKEINAITIHVDGKMISFGLKDFTPKNGSKYYKFTNEEAMLRGFISIVAAIKPDIISGWHVEGYDIPYLIRRCFMIVGDDTKKISPWGIIRDKQIPLLNGNKLDTFEILGITVLDYMELYKKYGKKRDSYTLANVSHLELGTTKISLGKYKTLARLYKENPQLYMEYNQRDVELLPMLEKKLKYIFLVMSVAYYAKCNYADVPRNTRVWDSIIYSYLLQRRVIVDARDSLDIGEVKKNIAGGHVKLPVGGMYKWVLTYDATSLYPSLIMSYNISPETFVDKIHLTPEMILDHLNGKISGSFRDRAIKENLSLCANGSMFRKDKRGWFAIMTNEMFDLRRVFKNKQLETEREIERVKLETPADKSLLEQLETEKTNAETMQNAIKINLNSLFGAMANEGFRYNHSHFSEAITLSGQLSIMWTENCMNKFMNTIFKTENVDYVIYCDTDSVMLNAEKIALLCPSQNTEDIVNFMDKFGKEKIQPFMDKAFQKLQNELNYYEQRINFKREKICDKAVFMNEKKKRYIMSVWDKEGTRYHEPEISVTGIEAVRSSTPMIVRDVLKEAFKKMMTEDNDTVLRYLESFRERFKKESTDVIGIPTSANGLSVYGSSATIYSKGTPMHVRAALLFNHHAKRLNLPFDTIKDGEKIKYVHLLVPNPIQENVIAFTDELPEEFGLHEYIDYETQFNKTFLSPLEKIFDVIGWKVKDTATLGDFLFD